jgi:hypothetical protein
MDIAAAAILYFFVTVDESCTPAILYWLTASPPMVDCIASNGWLHRIQWLAASPPKAGCIASNRAFDNIISFLKCWNFSAGCARDRHQL